MIIIPLHEIFKPEQIKLDMASFDRDDAFEELVDHLVKFFPAMNREIILSAVREREDKMSTGLKNGIAIPHGKIEDLNEIRGVIGISNGGIEYDSLDQKPVHIIFLFISGKAMVDEHLSLLMRISALIENNGCMKHFLKAKNSIEINQIIKINEKNSI